MNDKAIIVHLAGTDIVPAFSFCYELIVKMRRWNMENNVIEIQGLTKSYGKNRGVIDVSFCVKEGDIFGFIGPNGAGKSTTIRSMLGFLKINSGSIRILGMDSVKDHEKILKEVGYMPSEAWFYDSMRVGDVIRYAADVRGIDCSKEAEMLCHRLKVDTKKRIKELSLGNRKKVSIVCAMQHRPNNSPTTGDITISKAPWIFIGISFVVLLLYIILGAIMKIISPGTFITGFVVLIPI